MKTYQDIENERSVWLEIKRKLEISFSGEDYVSFDSSEIEIMKDLYLKSDLIISKGSRLGKKTNPNLFIGLYICYALYFLLCFLTFYKAFFGFIFIFYFCAIYTYINDYDVYWDSHDFKKRLSSNEKKALLDKINKEISLLENISLSEECYQFSLLNEEYLKLENEAKIKLQKDKDQLRMKIFTPNNLEPKISSIGDLNENLS